MDKLRVLLVDDHEVVRLGIRALLNQSEGFEVVGEASNARESIELTAEIMPDIVLMDIRLPGMSGIEACEEITQKNKDVKVVMLTSYAEDEMLFAAIRAGASGYLLKQISSEDLIRSLNSVARGDAALLDPMVTQRVFQEVRRAVKEEEASAFAVLSQQEKHVLMLVSEGKTNREIAKSLFLGEGTVRNYVSSILSKLGTSNRAEAAAYAVEHNLKEYV
ncbi:DNA-binding response regulator [Anaerolineaceae bacterium oral taxon 439]|nr:DNA-binding response regulator [Anaerolineaceae bacterium oral taxon 439]